MGVDELDMLVNCVAVIVTTEPFDVPIALNKASWLATAAPPEAVVNGADAMGITVRLELLANVLGNTNVKVVFDDILTVGVN